MREIKFRIWRVDRKKYVQDEDWYYLSDEGELWNIYSHYCNKDFCNPELYIVEQYTGLKDRNGKEIYEGDVIRTQEGDIQEVRWVNQELGFGTFVSFIAYSKKPPHAMGLSKSDEIIGNIHENPELLEV